MKNDQQQKMKQDGVVRIDARTGGSPHSASGQPIRIIAFVDGDAIPPSCYNEPYCLSPSKNDSKAYDVLREVMQRTRKVGLAAVVIEKQQALAAVIPIGRTLVLNVLRFATGLGRRGSPVRGQPSIDRPIFGNKPLISATASRPRAESKIAALPFPKVVTARRRAPAPFIVAEATTLCVPPVSDRGEVIDLAARRSSKRASSRRLAKASRVRTPAVATLHELTRKEGTQIPSTERQLA